MTFRRISDDITFYSPNGPGALSDKIQQAAHPFQDLPVYIVNIEKHTCRNLNAVQMQQTYGACDKCGVSVCAYVRV